MSLNITGHVTPCNLHKSFWPGCVTLGQACQQQDYSLYASTDIIEAISNSTACAYYIVEACGTSFSQAWEGLHVHPLQDLDQIAGLASVVIGCSSGGRQPCLKQTITAAHHKGRLLYTWDDMHARFGP